MLLEAAPNLRLGLAGSFKTRCRPLHQLVKELEACIDVLHLVGDLLSVPGRRLLLGDPAYVLPCYLELRSLAGCDDCLLSGLP